MGRFIWLLVVALVVLACSLGAGRTPAVPAPEPAWNPNEVNGVSLEIGLRRDCPQEFPSKEDWDMRLQLSNRATVARTVKELLAPGNRLTVAEGISYVFWFPDGTTLEGRPYLVPFHDDFLEGMAATKPLTIPAEGALLGSFNFHHAMGGAHHEGCARNNGRFCVAAVIPKLGVQSNVIRYNKCPAPPAKFSPLQVARAALAERERKESWLREGRERAEQAESAKKASAR